MNELEKRIQTLQEMMDTATTCQAKGEVAKTAMQEGFKVNLTSNKIYHPNH